MARTDDDAAESFSFSDILRKFKTIGRGTTVRHSELQYRDAESLNMNNSIL